MSVPNLEGLPLYSIPIAVFSASLLGSLHCSAMCGGLVLSTVRSRADAVVYHLSRWIGYLTLGALAGAAGELALTRAAGPILQWSGTLLLAAGFGVMSIQVFRGRTPHLPLPRFFLKWLPVQMSQASPAVVGLLSAFLPCGWLYAFVLGAMATRSAMAGILFISAFWMGTLPALGFAPILIQRVLRPFSIRAPLLSGALLMGAALATLGFRISPQASRALGQTVPVPFEGTQTDCPMHQR